MRPNINLFTAAFQFGTRHKRFFSFNHHHRRNDDAVLSTQPTHVRCLHASILTFSDSGNGLDYSSTSNGEIHPRFTRSTLRPHFRSNPQTFRIAEGDAARLPCYVDNLGKPCLLGWAHCKEAETADFILLAGFKGS